MPGNLSDSANRTRRADSRRLQREASITRDSDNNESPTTPTAHASALDLILVTQELTDIPEEDEDTIDFEDQPAAGSSNQSDSGSGLDLDLELDIELTIALDIEL